MTEQGKPRRGGLGRGLGALIPTAPPDALAPGTDAEAAVSRETTPESTLVAAGTSSHGVTTVRDAPTHAGGGVAPVAPDDAPAPQPVPGATFAELPVAEIHANTKQPRQVFDEDALAELTHSIREFGVLQPVVVRADADGYELVMGERRLRAATAAGLDTIPAIIRGTADDAMLRDALLENIHRAQLNPLEEAAAYQQLLEEFGTTHDELAHRIGRSRPQVTNTIRLLNLPLAVQRRVAAGVLSAGHARALLGLDDADAQDDLAARIVAEGMSVRATEEAVTLTRPGGAPKRRRTAGPRITAPAATDLADKLSDVFDTRVRVELGRRKGKITVEFGSLDDLERIIGLMAPGVARRSRQPAAGPSVESSGANEP